MKENQLLENKQMREKCMGRIEVLEKVKKLILLPNTEFATTEMVANYYEVKNSTIEKLVERNNEELIYNGYGVKTKENLLTDNVSVKTKRGGFDILDNEKNIVASGSNKGIALFSQRAILNVGMLLRDSKIAREVRTQLLNGFDNAVEEQRVDLFTKDIDEEMRLNIELAEAFASGDMTKMLIASQNINNFKNRKIKSLEDENGKLRIFLGDAEIFTKSSLADKLDTHTTTMSKVLKEEKIYTKTCKVSERFKAKFPNVKIIQETKEKYTDKEGVSHTKVNWQWTKQGAFELIKYLISKGKVIETENNQYKLCKN